MEQLLDLKERNKCANIFRMLVLSSGGFYFGYYTACMNPLAKPILEGVLKYDPVRDADKLNTFNGLVNFLFGIGAFIGVFSTGQLANNLGRRTMLYAGEIIALLNIIPSVIVGIGPLMISRILSGLVSGINVSIYSIILSEYLPNNLSGIGGSLGNLFLSLGMMLSFVCQNIWTYEEIVSYWQVFLAYPLVFSLLRLMTFPLLFKTDTPRYIFERAQKLHKKKKGSRVAPRQASISPTKESLPQPGDRIETSEPLQNDETDRPTARDRVDTEPDTADLKTSRIEQGPYSSNVLKGFGSTNILLPPTSERKALRPDIKRKSVKKYSRINYDLVNVGLADIVEAYKYIYQLESARMIATKNASFWVKTQALGTDDIKLRHLFGKFYRRQLFSGAFVSFALQFSGINFFIYYSTALFDELANNGKLITLVVGISNIAGAIISAPMIFKLGRKLNLTIGTSCQALGLLLLAVGYTKGSVSTLMAGTIFYMAGFSIGLGGTQTAYVSEILPPSGVGFSFSIQWIFDTVTALAIPFFMIWVGPLAMILFFLVFNVISVIVMGVTCVETKDKCPEAVFDEFNKSIFHLC